MEFTLIEPNHTSPLTLSIVRESNLLSYTLVSPLTTERVTEASGMSTSLMLSSPLAEESSRVPAKSSGSQITA